MPGLQSRPFAADLALFPQFTQRIRTQACKGMLGMHFLYCVPSTLLGLPALGSKACVRVALKTFSSYTCRWMCRRAHAAQGAPSAEPESHLPPSSHRPSGWAQPCSACKHLIQAPDALSNPGHRARPRQKFPRHTQGPYNLEATLMYLPSTCSSFPPRRTPTCYLMREELCVGAGSSTENLHHPTSCVDFYCAFGSLVTE